MSTMKRPDEAFIELLKRSGSADKNEALTAQRELAKAIEAPLRQGVLVGNILDGIFEAIQMEPGSTSEFPLDLLAPGEEDEFVAYTNPGHGRIPERAAQLTGCFGMPVMRDGTLLVVPLKFWKHPSLRR